MRRRGSRGDPGPAGSPPGRPDLRGGGRPAAERPEIHPAGTRRLRRSPVRYLTASILVLVTCLLVLVQAGASGARSSVNPAGTPTPGCTSEFRVAFITDVAGLQSTGDSDGWRGVGDAVRDRPCFRARLIVPSRPSEYRRSLQSGADAHDDLVIAASFLLTDAVVAVARANPGTRFVLVDPLVATPGLPNLAVLSFREDQAAYLSGALSGFLTRSGMVAGVYGPDGATDHVHRLGFEHGARFARPGVRVLGAYQPPSDGAPYANPGWGLPRPARLSPRAPMSSSGPAARPGRGRYRPRRKPGGHASGPTRLTRPPPAAW
ncbi:MAG: BMP family ABC transporter substrate-binding protein [Chloroflexi bacterium]|nr:MAG: BMP family ABC transporter substrate-binding protein [Chloroflexota bacterium]